MNEKRTIRLSLPSQLGYEQVAMESAAAAARMMGFTPDRVADLKTAVSEACMNAIEHGNRQRTAVKVLVVLTVEASKLQIDVHDQGTGITEEVEPPNLEEKLAGQGTTRGWGMFLIKKLVDKVEFETKPGNGNVTRMIIYLQKSYSKKPKRGTV